MTDLPGRRRFSARGWNGRVPLLRLGLVALALGVMLGFAAVVGGHTAHAQTTTNTLVKNIDNPLGSLTQGLHAATPKRNRCCANPALFFNTGTHTNGYDVTSVKIRFAGLPAASRVPTVTIKTAKDNDQTVFSSAASGSMVNPAKIPDAAVGTLSTTWPARGEDQFSNTVITFTSTDISLKANEDYFLVIEGKSIDGEDGGYIRYSKSNDYTQRAGWTIAIEGYWYVPFYGIWVHHESRKPLVEILGTDRSTAITSGQKIADPPADTTPPTPTLSRAGEGAVNGEFPVTVSFDEPTTGFSPMSDLDVSGGSIARSVSQSDGTSHQAWIEPDAGVSEVTVSVAAGAAEDTAGNLSEASNTLRVAVLAPLTASWTPPSTHDGTEFWIELRFSEAPSLSFRDLRDSIAQADGGTVRKAKRIQRGSNLGWRLLVDPDGSGDVTLSLASSGACSTSTAVCTGDGRALSNSLAATVLHDDD